MFEWNIGFVQSVLHDWYHDPCVVKILKNERPVEG